MNALILQLSLRAYGQTAYLDPSDSIQSAMMGNDLIVLSAGTYHECVEVWKPISIIGDGSALVTLDCGGLETGALFVSQDGADLTLQGLTIRNAGQRGVVVSPTPYDVDGDDHANFGFTDVVFVDLGNFVDRGGGVYISHANSDVAFSDCRFENNVGVEGGAIYVINDANPISVTDTTFTGNYASSVGGAMFFWNELVTLTGVTFEDNGSGGGGGAVYAWGNTERLLVAVDTAFRGNYAASGWGGATAYSNSLDIDGTNLIFEDNSAPSGAGAVTATHFTLTGGQFSRNTTGGNGGAAHVEGTLFLDDVRFEDNEAHYGGALYRVNNTGLPGDVITNSEFSGNASTAAGGAILNSSYAPLLTVQDSAFSDNTASEGGAIVVSDYGSLELVGTTFEANSVLGDGGAIRAGGGTTLTVSDSTFSSNAAVGGGGAVDAGGNLTVSESWFSDNLVSNTSSYTGGGAIRVNTTDYTVRSVTNSTFCANGVVSSGADPSGGAVFVRMNGGSTSFRNNVFQDNYTTGSATSQGGAIASTGGDTMFQVTVPTLVVENNTFAGNEALIRGSHLKHHRYSGPSTVTYRNNGFVGGSAGNYAMGCPGYCGTMTAAYNLFWDVGLGNITWADAYTSISMVTSDPAFYAYSDDGDCTNDDFTPAPGSPLLDGGDPAVLDPNGSVSDIGAFGGPGSSITDLDLDGWYGNHDCDDGDGDIHPDAPELCDGVDNDCDGAVDDGAADTLWYPDIDIDGFGQSGAGVPGCLAVPPYGFVGNGDDCDDDEPLSHPGAVEACDGIDNDCDGLVDTDAAGFGTWHEDSDGDGFGASDPGVGACVAPAGWVEDASDCDDGDGSVYPGAPETPYDAVDQDCAGGDLTDVDGDGVDAASVGGDDCDDDDPTINPYAGEIAYDGLDQDCDGVDLTDVDGDLEDAEIVGGQDCDDLDPDVNSLAPWDYWYDGVDQDCDGGSDYDQDLDGFDSAAHGGDDCSDLRVDVHPGAPETVGDGVDFDCDGREVCYQDNDRDLYRTTLTRISSDVDCADPREAMHTRPAGDCNDAARTVNPGLSEVCANGRDDDCDGLKDEGC